MKKIIMILTVFCIIVSLTVAGNAKEVLFEDNFEGESLADHWNVVKDRSGEPIEWFPVPEPPAEYYVKDGNLVVDAQMGDVYFDLEGYSFTGDFTVEIKFKFSSERIEGPRNFSLWLRRPKDPDISWYNLDGHYIAVRPACQLIAFWDIDRTVADDHTGTEFSLADIFWGRDAYDEWFVLKIVSKDNVHFLYLDGEDLTDLAGFESGFEPRPLEHGGFSITAIESIISFDYIKVYR